MKIVIYHQNCNDGFGSALVAWKKFGDNAEYYPALHYTKPPDVKGKDVYILDFSYKKDIMIKMIEEANSLIIIDHHKSAENDLKEIPNENKIFNMKNSGAVLTWKYFYPQKPVPKLLQYIEDRDIWKNEMLFSKECFFGLNQIDKEFIKWNLYLTNDNKIQELIESGKIILKHNNDLINFVCKSSYLLNHKLINQKSYKIAYLNSNVLKSDLGNYLVENHFPDSDFAVIYHYDGKDNKTIFSLRSLDSKIDVSEIADLYKGGGHRNAAGLSLEGFHNHLI